MIYASTIGFATTPSNSKLLNGKVKHIGRIRHNNTLAKDEIIGRFASFIGSKSSQAEMYVNGLCEFIKEELSNGNRLDFEDFAIGVTMEGGFPAANSPFDPKVNKLKVQMMAKKGLSVAVARLRPVNETGAERSRIFSVRQKGLDDQFEVMSQDGRREIVLNGEFVRIHPEASDEGVWIETRMGERLLTGEPFKNDDVTCDFYLEGHLDPGEYWLIICSRSDSKRLLRAKRLIRVV